MLMSKKCTFQGIRSGAAVVLACTVSLPLSAYSGSFDIASENEFFQTEEKIVSIASKRAQPLAEAPSAVSVITADDIRESGARSLADVLSRVPGMDINYSTGSTFAMSTRGYSAEKASHMLVLLDGVSQYTTLYGEPDGMLCLSGLKKLTGLKLSVVREGYCTVQMQLTVSSIL